MSFHLRRSPSFTVKHEAYPYQVDAVRALRDLTYAAVFHEQGLGKTKIAIDILLSWLGDDVVDTVFVVTKKMLVQNWVDELALHCHVTPNVLGRDRRRNGLALSSAGLIYVMNYEMVHTNRELLEDFLATCRVGAILDESQKIKNPNTRLAATFHELAVRFRRRLILTGTPVANRPFDIWSQVKFLDQGKALGTSFEDFREAYDLPRQQDADSASRYRERLAGTMAELRSFSVRETKSTAGVDLPAKTIRTHTLEMAPRQWRIYAEYRDRVAVELRQEQLSVTDDLDSVLKRLLRLVQCASNPRLLDPSYTERPGKLERSEQLLRELTANGAKAVLWTQFVANVDWLAAHFSQYRPQRLHGQMSLTERHRALTLFKGSPETRLLVATPGAAKEGLTLTVASHAIFYDRSFSLDDYLQAQDRIHRLSQTSPCFVHNLMAKNSVDEWVDSLLQTKHRAAQLAQGDIGPSDFEDRLAEETAEILKSVLSGSRQGTAQAPGR